MGLAGEGAGGSDTDMEDDNLLSDTPPGKLLLRPFLTCSALTLLGPTARLLDDLTRFQIALYAWSKDFSISTRAYDALSTLMAQIPPSLSLSSLFISMFRLETLMYDKSGVQITWSSQCPRQHILFTDPRYSHLTSCPEKGCGAPRFHPPSTRIPNVKKRGQKLPPLEEQPTSQHATIEIEPLIRALLAHPSLGPAIHKTSWQRSREIDEKDISIIGDIHEGSMMVGLRRDGFIGEFDLSVLFTSDGAVLYDKLNLNEGLHFHFAASQVSSLYHSRPYQG